MKSNKQTNCITENWIAEKELPVKATIKVIRKNHPDYGLTEDEIQDRNEFIRCHLLSEFELLTMLLKQDTEDDFFIFDCSVNDTDYSAFNTNDYLRTRRPFNKYYYAIKKLMERIRDLAIMHSCISDESGRLEVYNRYEAFVEREFRLGLADLVDRYRRELNDEKRIRMKERIAEISRRIMDCKRIWAQYAPAENWDR
jgi:hypothetical protein